MRPGIPAWAARRIAGLVEVDLTGAVVSSSSAYVEADGRIRLDELTIRIPGGQTISIAAEGALAGGPADLKLEAHGLAGWREVTVGRNYATELQEILSGPSPKDKS